MSENVRVQCPVLGTIVMQYYVIAQGSEQAVSFFKVGQIRLLLCPGAWVAPTSNPFPHHFSGPRPDPPLIRLWRPGSAFCVWRRANTQAPYSLSLHLMLPGMLKRLHFFLWA